MRLRERSIWSFDQGFENLEGLLYYIHPITIMEKLISIDLYADFGFFRKPDTNDGINLSYNMLHKPALLGILGAIIGLEGYQEYGKFPVYYEKLKDLKAGIAPLRHEKGNFLKTVIKYSNTVGYANKGTNYLTEEATLVTPAYRCYLLLNTDTETQQKLYEYLKAGKAEYLPYFGKNEFSAWWEAEGSGFQEYNFKSGIQPEVGNLKILTLFQKSNTVVSEQKQQSFAGFGFGSSGIGLDDFLYFERLPSGFNEDLKQYELCDFAFTTFPLSAEAKIDNLFFLTTQAAYVQLS